MTEYKTYFLPRDIWRTKF